MEAVQSDDFQKLHTNLHAENWRADDVNMALLVAAKCGNLACLKLVIAHDLADVNVMDRFQYSPLMLATKGRHAQCVDYLIDCDANVNFRSFAGFYESTAMSIAIGNEDVECVRLLKEGGIDARHVLMNPCGSTYIAMAVGKRNDEIVKLMLAMRNVPLQHYHKDQKHSLKDQIFEHSFKDHRTHIDAYSFSDSPQIISVKNGDISALEMLLEAGAPADTTDLEGNTLLIKACSKGHLGCAQILVGHGAKVHVLNKRYLSALDEAVYGNYLDCVKLLLENGADTGDAESVVIPLLVATRNGNFAIVKELVKAGACINARVYCHPHSIVKHENSPLVTALKNDNIEIAQYLYDKGADPNYINTEEDSNLIAEAFVSIGSSVAVKAAKWLIKHGAILNTNEGLYQGLPPLLSLCRKRSLCYTQSILCIVKQMGGDVDVQDIDGCTALSICFNEYFNSDDSDDLICCYQRIMQLIQQGINVNQRSHLQCQRKETEPQEHVVDRELPLEMAIRSCTPRLAKYLWDAGSSPGKAFFWNRTNIPWYTDIRTTSMITVFGDETLCFLASTVQQPRRLIEWGRIAIREQLRRTNPHTMQSACCFKKRVRQLSVPIHLYEYIELTNRSESA